MPVSTPETQTRVLLAERPVGEPTPESFRVEAVPVPAPADGQVLLRTIWLSLDPYMRGRMSAAKSYAAPVEVGDVMEGGTVCEVVASNSPDRSVGDVVLAYTGWQEYAVAPARATRRLDPSAAPISTALGVLGMPGFTAYAGLLKIGHPQPGETVVVAAAAGPVGSAVGQIAKIAGARAVGIAGGPEKCAYVVDELGFDACLDHREPDLAGRLAAAAPDGIDVYFENVGGAVLEAVVPLLNTYARVPVCGLVSQYNATSAPQGPDRAPALMSAILTKSLTVRGFIQTEFVKDHQADFQSDMATWVADGRVKHREDVADGIESAPEAFIGMLRGRNHGKQLVRVGADPTADGA
ncbi:NADP-dependent oxidoreductase [Solicola sp. PLA-1-18]|uniref:NADP-dependent oxidoreductase n=1 Tax=Solicola sp. PLA-1-18 TaxID=3380532 RepID=UPI003B7A78A5